tara:strand:+ start:5897 stop:6499 length:603 start_codon:yes stop_codon:yes gene_type:complete
MSFHAPRNNQMDNNDMQLNNVGCWSDDDDDDITLTKDACPLCSFVDDAKDGPMAWMRHTYHCHVCTMGASELYRMLAQGYRDMFYAPMMQRGITMPDIQPQHVSHHFRKHETSSIFTLKQDIRRIEQMQRVLVPRRTTDDGTRYIDRDQMKAWLELSKAKQDAIKLMEVEARHASGQMQQAVVAPNLEETANSMLASNLC